VRWRAFIALLVVVAVAGALGLAVAPGSPPPVCRALPATWDRGINFTSWWHDAYASERAARSFDQLAATGANAVALLATQYQHTADASEVVADPLRTPSDQALAVAVERAKRNDMKVRLRIMVDSESGESRTDFAPADVAGWFASYRARVLHYAALARSLNVHTLEIGAELKGLTGPANAARWRGLVAATRAVFHGRVAYSANWDEYRQITWWDALDEIAIDAYFPFPLGEAPSEDAVVAAWTRFVDPSGVEHRYLDEIAAVAARFHRPVVFSELGYWSAVGALATPWAAGTSYSATEQEIGLVAAFRALADRPWFRGLYIWHWNEDPDAGGPGDTDHTIQGKPARAPVTAWFHSSAPGACVPSTPAPASEPAPPTDPATGSDPTTTGAATRPPAQPPPPTTTAPSPAPEPRS
jgi:hypothetical protein